MKKRTLFVLITVLVLALLVACGGNKSSQSSTSTSSSESTESKAEAKNLDKKIKVDNKIASPTIKPESPSGTKVPGGVQYTISTSDPEAVLYYGIVDFDIYNHDGATYIYADSWTIRELGKYDSSSGPEASFDVKTPGRSILFAVAVKGNKSSSFSRQVVEVKQASSENLERLSIQNGYLSGTGDGEYFDVYASLDENMKDAILVKDGMLPTDFLGKKVSFQIRNMNGFADSESIIREVDSPKADKPKIIIEEDYGGKNLILNVEDVYLTSSSRGPKLDKSLIKVYYTLDGTTPVPGQSTLYEGPVLLGKGSYLVRAVSCVGTNVSETAALSVKVKRAPAPTVTVKGLDIRVTNNDSGAIVVWGDSKSGANTVMNESFAIIDESFVGSTIQIKARRRGYADSLPVELTIDSLSAFQEKYSADKTRQFGYWIVVEEYNSKSKKSTYSMCARWPMGAKGRYMIAPVSIKSGKIENIIFVSPSYGDYNNIAWFTSPWSLHYTLDNENKAIGTEVYNVNTSTFEATYYIAINKNTDSKLLSKINNGNVFKTEFKLQQEISALDALGMMSAASNYSNPDAAMSAMMDNVQLGEHSFIFDTNGLPEALAYYKKVSK